MPFVLLLLLLLITLHDAWPNALGCDVAGSCFITWSGIMLLTLSAEFASWLSCRALRNDPARRTSVMRLFARWKRWHLLGLLGFFIFALYVFGWGWTIQQAEQQMPLPGLRVAMLTPLLAGMALGWLRHYDVERLNFEIGHYPDIAPFLSRWSYVGLQARYHLLFVLPPVLLLMLHEGVFLAVPALKDSKHSQLMSLVGIGLLAMALIVIPLFLRLFLGLKPLAEGPLRERLLATARRLRFRSSDILVWNTRNGVANAMVTGVLPWLRYVVLTDRLLDELNEDEVEAVFGHEAGHMMHHHMSFYMVFIMASLMVLGGLWSAGEPWIQQIPFPSWLGAHVNAAAWHSVAIWFALALIAVYILVVFGWLSRRCERQADIFGCTTASPQAFISALEKVADLNGIPQERPGFFSWWQHSTIADRIRFIRRMETDPTLGPRFQRRMGWMKWSLSLGMIALLTWMLVQGEWDLSRFNSTHTAKRTAPSE
jgi:STE24 endopeptidase